MRLTGRSPPSLRSPDGAAPPSAAEVGAVARPAATAVASTAVRAAVSRGKVRARMGESVGGPATRPGDRGRVGASYDSVTRRSTPPAPGWFSRTCRVRRGHARGRAGWAHQCTEGGRRAVERLRRGRQPRRAGDPRARFGGPDLHRPAVQHRQRLRLRRRLPRRIRQRQPGHPARGLGPDDAAPAGRRAGRAARVRRDLRQHRRQRGRPPAAADGRGVRRGQLRRPGRGEPQRQGPPARVGLRDQPRVPPGLRPRPAGLRPRRDLDVDRRARPTSRW